MKHDLKGLRFGRLVVVERAPNRTGRTAWLCKCDCGNEKTIVSKSLVRGATQSCGCLNKEITVARCTTHGHDRRRSRSPEYKVWAGMVDRCTRPTSSRWKWYGALGVTVCDRWRSFENFLADMGPRPEGMSLDRVNPFGNYEPSNCRWATAKEQAQNTRRKYEARAA